MTMVLSAMTDKHVFVVSDRRMTDARTGKVLSSTENKAVILNGEMVLTYTGFCNLEGLPTDVWVSEVLKGQPVSTWLQTLLNRVGPAVRAVQVSPSLQCHAFLLNGYVKLPEGRNRVRPVGFLISNFHDGAGKSLGRAESKFWLSILRMGNWKVRVDSIGRDLPDHRRMAVEKAIRMQMRAAPDQPQRVLDILGSQVRQVAANDAGVGSDLMAVSFPLAALGGGLNIIVDPSDVNWTSDLMSFYASINSEPVSYGPTYVGRDMQIIGPAVIMDQGSRADMHRFMARQMRGNNGSL